MKNILLLFLSAPLWGVSYGQAKTVTVYTTADKSDLRRSGLGDKKLIAWEPGPWGNDTAIR